MQVYKQSNEHGSTGLLAPVSFLEKNAFSLKLPPRISNIYNMIMLGKHKCEQLEKLDWYLLANLELVDIANSDKTYYLSNN